MIDNYINQLLENVNHKNIYKNIDLVLEGGAFNGSYMIGCLLYLKQMEEKQLIYIDRISGCSVGAILGLCFLTNKIELAITNAIKMMEFIRKTQDLSLLKNYYDTILDLILNDIDIKKINNKLFITYFDIKKKEQVITSTYKNKKYLKKILRKSIHVPFMIDRNMCYNNSIDGCYPFIFKERTNKILFINLQTLEKIKNIYVIKNEKNIFARILTGILDIHNFYTNNTCDMCSYVNDWSIYQILLYRSKELIFTLLCYLINISLILKKYIPNCIDDNIYYNKLLVNINNIYNDIIIYYTN